MGARRSRRRRPNARRARTHEEARQKTESEPPRAREEGSGGWEPPRTPRGRRDQEVYRGATGAWGEAPEGTKRTFGKSGCGDGHEEGLSSPWASKLGSDVPGGSGVRSALPGGGSAKGLAEEREPLDGDEKEDSEGMKDRAEEVLPEAVGRGQARVIGGGGGECGEGQLPGRVRMGPGRQGSARAGSRGGPARPGGWRSWGRSGQGRPWPRRRSWPGRTRPRRRCGTSGRWPARWRRRGRS